MRRASKMHFRRRLPSLTALLTLEAVLRRKSFTVAAGELGVTQAAVSRQIATLEEELGQPLFLRKHRAIEPTAACLTLGATLAQSFANIAESIEAIKLSAQDVVTIGATVAFSSFWLLPRLADFRRLNPGVQVRVVSQDNRIDLDSGEIDIVIRYGLPPFSDGTVIASQGDIIMPVCSPDYLKNRVAGPRSPPAPEKPSGGSAVASGRVHRDGGSRSVVGFLGAVAWRKRNGLRRQAVTSVQSLHGGDRRRTRRTRGRAWLGSPGPHIPERWDTRAA
jgi:DNA-binding transcriptional LysR family regulator